VEVAQESSDLPFCRSEASVVTLILYTDLTVDHKKYEKGCRVQYMELMLDLETCESRT